MVSGETWDTLRIYGLGTYCVLLGSWATSCAPFVLLDNFGWADRYRIQNAKDGGLVPAAASKELRQKAWNMITFNWGWMLPALCCASPLLQKLFPATGRFPDAVSVRKAVPIAALWFVMHDMSFYCYHRLLHEVPGLYIRFHKPHHLFTAPFAWMSHALHPVEVMLQSIGALAGPLLWAKTCGLSLEALWAWLALIQFQGVMDHTGYELPFPFDIFTYIPGCGGTLFHDDHHRLFTCNYAAVFSVIDEFMGTSRKCREAAKLKKAQEK